MFRANFFLLLALMVCASSSARASETNSLIWHSARDQVSADIHDETLWPLLKDIAHQTGWNIFVEPGASHDASVKFRDLPAGEALRKLLGDLNYALVPETNGPQQLYVFKTTMHNATQRVAAEIVKAPPQRHSTNELILKVKPGTDIDALAKSLGAKVVGRSDKLGLYKLEFDDAADTDAALAQLKNNSDVAAVDYNYIYDQPVTAQRANGAAPPATTLTLNPPGDSGRVIVGLVDTHLQSMGSELDQFLLKQLSVTGDPVADSADPTHATGMFQTIIDGIAAQGGSTSAQILAVDVYGNSETTSSWNVALGIQQAIDGGANLINLSLGGTSDSLILDDLIQQGEAKGIVFIVAAGNTPGVMEYPAADPGVHTITALSASGQLASYANYGDFVQMALPGQSLVYLNGQAYIVQGTSPATAFATGIAAGVKSGSTLTWAQILAAMQQKFPVPQ